MWRHEESVVELRADMQSVEKVASKANNNNSGV